MSAVISIVVKSLFLGAIVVLMGLVSSRIVKVFHRSVVPRECANWNKHHLMEKSLFITGFLTGVLIQVINLLMV